MWRLEPGKAQERYDELLTQLPGVQEKDEVASRSFARSENDIRGVGFLDGPRGVVDAAHVRRQPVHVGRRRGRALEQVVYDETQDSCSRWASAERR